MLFNFMIYTCGISCIKRIMLFCFIMYDNVALLY